MFQEYIFNHFNIFTLAKNYQKKKNNKKRREKENSTSNVNSITKHSFPFYFIVHKEFLLDQCIERIISIFFHQF